MNTVIIGNGLIAKAAATKLVAAGHQVTIASRNIEDEIENVKYKKSQLEEIAGDSELFSEADNVIHAISTTAPSNSMIDIYRDAYENILLNIRLIDTLSKLKIKKFIFISSGGAVYGNPVEKIVTETHPTNPISAYGVAKLSVEKYLYLYGYHFGLNYMIVRPSNVYGYIRSVKKPQGVINHMLDCAMNQKPFKLWGSLLNCKDYLYVDDLAEALLLALNFEAANASSIYNISYGQTHSLKEILEIVEEKTSRKIKIEQVEGSRFDVKNIDIDNNLFKKDFNWNPFVDIRAGIEKIIQQY